MTNEFRDNYIQNGTVVRAEQFEDELIDIIRTHFRQTSRAFSKTLRRDIQKAFHPDIEYKQGEVEIEQALREFIAITSLAHAAFITRTSNNIFNEAVQRALFEFVQSGEDFTQADVGRRAREIAMVQNLPRANNIATTITQNAAEGSKFVEAQTLIRTGAVLTGNISVGEGTVKEWVSVLDGVTRKAHAIADGQRVGVDEAFVVDGELLMFPGDISLGATAKNTNHCRCGSSFVIDEMTVSEERVDTRLRNFATAAGPTFL